MTAVEGVAVSLAHLREDYRLDELHEGDVDPDPLRQFALWFDEARQASRREPNAMTVATASADGEPSARTVLLKAFDERGFVFYTHYDSAKGHDLAANPRAALLFYWPELERQVRISGTVEQVAHDESTAYFRGRPRGSQMAAAVSHQSAVLPSRERLHDDYARFEAEHEGGEIAPPEHWGGYRVAPAVYEFWQGRPSRLHDRLRYRRQPDDRWVIERLAP
ncbi:MAG: pyridoxamine 5'-phosphate oxidase [Thermomicrobiales bacterium]